MSETEVGIKKKYEKYLKEYPNWFVVFDDHFYHKEKRSPTREEYVKYIEEALRKYFVLINNVKHPLVRIWFITLPPVPPAVVPTKVDVPQGFFFYIEPTTKRYYELVDEKLKPTDPEKIYRKIKPPPPPVIPVPPVPPVPAPPLEIWLPPPEYTLMGAYIRAGVEEIWRKGEKIKEKYPDFYKKLDEAGYTVEEIVKEAEKRKLI